MKKVALWKTFILPLVTFGIWKFFWTYRTGKDSEEKSKLKVPSILFLLWPLALVLVGLLFVIFARGSEVSEVITSNQSDVKADSESSPLELLVIIPIVAIPLTAAYYYYKWGKALEKATEGKVNAMAATLLMFFISWPVGIPYIQYEINKYIDSK